MRNDSLALWFAQDAFGPAFAFWAPADASLAQAMRLAEKRYPGESFVTCFMSSPQPDAST